jgi:hypothetical protein
MLCTRAGLTAPLGCTCMIYPVVTHAMYQGRINSNLKGAPANQFAIE